MAQETKNPRLCPRLRCHGPVGATGGGVVAGNGRPPALVAEHAMSGFEGKAVGDYAHSKTLARLPRPLPGGEASWRMNRTDGRLSRPVRANDLPGNRNP